MSLTESHWKVAESSQPYGQAARTQGQTLKSHLSNVPTPSRLKPDVESWYQTNSSSSGSLSTYKSFNPQAPGAIFIVGNFFDVKTDTLHGWAKPNVVIEFADVFNKHLGGEWQNLYNQWWNALKTSRSFVPVAAPTTSKTHYTNQEVADRLKAWKSGQSNISTTAQGYSVAFGKRWGFCPGARGLTGLYDDDTNKIYVNANAGDGSILLHEFIHSCQKRSWSEWTSADAAWLNDGLVDLFARLISAGSSTFAYKGNTLYNYPTAAAAKLCNSVKDGKGLQFLTGFYFDGADDSAIKAKYCALDVELNKVYSNDRAKFKSYVLDSAVESAITDLVAVIDTKV